MHWLQCQILAVLTQFDDKSMHIVYNYGAFMREADQTIFHQFQYNGLLIAILTKGDSKTSSTEKASLVECPAVKGLASECHRQQ